VETTPATGYGEAPELVGRNLWAGIRLWIGADAFFFAGFVFAFFYLRALDSNGLFRDPRDHQSTALGAAILVVTLLATALLWVGVTRVRAGDAARWRTAAGAALLLTVAAIVLQIVQFSQFGLDRLTYQGFGSVFLAWTAAYVVHLLGAAFWLETLVAQALRERGRPGHDAGLVAPAEACLVFYEFIAVVGVVMFVLLYLAAP
jgi:heme/copper-type cytochrome/quinol oxidase subunit 3